MKNNAHLHSKDLGGLTDILTDATLQITHVAEELSHQIVHPPFLPSTAIQGLISSIAGLAYQAVRLTTKAISIGIKTALTELDSPLLKLPKEEKEIALAILNGIVGDYLAEQGNHLTIPMQFRSQGIAISMDGAQIQQTIPAYNEKILIMVHGLCMNDLQWQFKGHNHGEALAKEFGMTPLYLRYNSGRHISENGETFNLLLAALVEHWPVKIEEIVILSHSMGGLVSRSALHQAQEGSNNWPKLLKKLIFLATPHQGAPLERIGNYIDRFLGAVPYFKPFARLGKLRSSGITDLRFSRLIKEDWVGRSRFDGNDQESTFIPLPTEIEAYALAASINKAADSFSANTLGDGLVQLKSALGQHKIAERSLAIPKKNQYIAFETNHLDILASLAVYEKLKSWLAD